MTLNRQFLVLAVMAMAVLSACTEPDTYPVTGEKASANDWVREDFGSAYYGR